MFCLVIAIATVGGLYFVIQDKKEEKAQKEQK